MTMIASLTRCTARSSLRFCRGSNRVVDVPRLHPQDGGSRKSHVVGSGLANHRCSSYATLETPTNTTTTAAAKSNESDSNNSKAHPKLVRIPSLPLVGSMLVPSYTGIPKVNLNDFGSYWRQIGEKHGPFFSVGVPGLGSGLFGTVYILSDPEEMHKKILAKEGTYPYGLIQQHWPISDWLASQKSAMHGLYGRDQEWKRIRTFLQQELLSPASAKEYLPAIVQGSAFAVQKLPQTLEKINQAENDPQQQRSLLELFFCKSAVDTFDYVMFGSDSTSSDINQADYETYCEAAATASTEIMMIKRDAWQNLARRLGIVTQRVRENRTKMDLVHNITTHRVSSFLERLKQEKLSGFETTSYLAKAAARQPTSPLTEQEMVQICSTVLVFAVDTTAAMTSWNVLQMALHPHIQEELYQQLDRVVQKEGALTPAAFWDRSKVPLLPAILRETHRCTPVAPFNLVKEISSSSVEVHGVEIPAGSTFMFNSLNPQLDPDLVQDPMKYQPERWYPEQVERRKGTPSAVIDHPFFSGAFSQGARRCPGSRVANLEVQALLANMVLNYKMVVTGPNSSNMHWMDVPGILRAAVVPEWPKGMEFIPR